MCGIVGYCGYRRTAQVLLEGLKRLEYRGYDSAGICIQSTAGALDVVKRTGKISNLQNAVQEGAEGACGIGHTRWATHGEVNESNAHPHNDAADEFSVVHNGIIENYLQLKQGLEAEGTVFRSTTDSEVIAHLVAKNYRDSLEQAVRDTLFLLKGTYGIAVISSREPGRIIGARNGSPLVIGVGDNEMFLASDVTAVLAYTRQAVYLNDGEMVSITDKEFTTLDLHDRIIQKQIELIDWELEQIERQGYKHFMEKEIHEQPESIYRAFQGRLNTETAAAHLGGLNMTLQELRQVERIRVIAAGTSYHAGMIGCTLLEQIARIPSYAELSSEVRYRNPVIEPNSLYIAVSQSGETADTLYALRELKRKGAKVLGMCNVVGSTIARESDGGVYLHSGPEIAVASTKAFTSQLSVFYLLSLMFARMKHCSMEDGLKFISALQEVYDQIRDILGRASDIRDIAKKYSHYRHMLFLGRGKTFPVALEGALKLKEISYIHAEGYSAAEIKHGPIALIDEHTPSVVLVPDDFLRDKVISNMKEVKARKGKIFAVAVEGDREVQDIADDVFFVPKAWEHIYPLLMVVPLQLFSYYCALELGCDVDRPRNLAKSVTVE